MKINISNLSEGEHHFNFTEEPSAFEIDTVGFASDVNVNLNLFKTVNQIELKVNFKVTLVLVCDRCLDEYRYKVDNDFIMIFKYRFWETLPESYNRKAGDAFEEEEPVFDDKSSDDNLIFISPRTKLINITKDVRDYILLSVPLRKVPEEKDGVCLYCNRRIEDLLKVYEQDSENPVWGKLNKFKRITNYN
jgi:uncharacterized metal-binding protein YceD (DUF177 family)